MEQPTKRGDYRVVGEGDAHFDYTSLELKTAKRVRVSTERIRQLVKRSLDDIIEIGSELQEVKQTLPHGQFIVWLNTELGWKERSARNFMNVANHFVSAHLSDIKMDLTAAYLLAAPSTPERARSVAIKRAGNGEHITVAAAGAIIAETKSKNSRGEAVSDADVAQLRALKMLEGLKKRWPEGHGEALARLLHEFADSLPNSP